MTTPKTDATYLKRRAKRGTKAAALTAARKAGLKTFIWKCPHHGETLHGTAGSGQCRLCVARFKKDHGERVKALMTEQPEREAA
ncbi:hypothetical protein [Caballeronia sp. GAFFF1]|uniref:hypothetical protein n=1 Tax=Caballeronia sp. GAFFF1 TaxID=2921779 RepID=UPI0020298C81|nr:hypothetical protein [Caballeronia sp. GAFFF1]